MAFGAWTRMTRSRKSQGALSQASDMGNGLNSPAAALRLKFQRSFAAARREKNKSRIAGLLHGPGSQAALCGFGAVFGSKNLKAISAIGSGSVPIGDPKAFMDARLWFRQFQWDVDNPREPEKFRKSRIFPDKRRAQRRQCQQRQRSDCAGARCCMRILPEGLPHALSVCRQQ